jgi:hypothetical protein
MTLGENDDDCVNAPDRENESVRGSREEGKNTSEGGEEMVDGAKIFVTTNDDVSNSSDETNASEAVNTADGFCLLYH